MHKNEIRTVMYTVMYAINYEVERAWNSHYTLHFKCSYNTHIDFLHSIGDAAQWGRPHKTNTSGIDHVSGWIGICDSMRIRKAIITHNCNRYVYVCMYVHTLTHY